MSIIADADFEMAENFGKAVCEHVGINHQRVHGVKVQTSMGEVLSISIDYYLTGADVEAIGKRMQGAAKAQVKVPEDEPSPGVGEFKVEHVDDPSVDTDQPIRFVWLLQDEATEEQQLFALGRDATGQVLRFGVALDNLTDEQRKQYADRVQVL